MVGYVTNIDKFKFRFIHDVKRYQNVKLMGESFVYPKGQSHSLQTIYRLKGYASHFELEPV